MAQLKNGKEFMADMLTEDRPEYIMIPIDKSTYPESQVRQKLAKTRNWSVCRSWMDEEHKLFVYECAINANEIVQKTINFKEACKELHWKKFDIVNNGQSLKWYKDPAWDDEIQKIMKRASKVKPEAEDNPKKEPALKIVMRK